MSLRERFRPAASAQPDADAEARAAQTLASVRGRPAIAPAPPASRALAAVLKPLMRDAGLGLGELKRRWVDIAGESFARASPEKLSGGVLTLKAPSALAPFLQQQAPLLIERLRLAGAKVATVRIEQRTSAPQRRQVNVAPLAAPLSPAEEEALAKALEPVADPRLRSALLRLGRAVRQG